MEADEGPNLASLYFEPRQSGSRNRSRRKGRGAPPDNKSRQLCRQVQQRLDIALGSELDDPVLQGLWVESVEAQAGGRSLVVRVVVPTGASILEVVQHLNAARGWLRAEVSAAINRKRTPNLQFVAMPEQGLVHGGEGCDDDG